MLASSQPACIAIISRQRQLGAQSAPRGQQHRHMADALVPLFHQQQPWALQSQQRQCPQRRSNPTSQIVMKHHTDGTCYVLPAPFLTPPLLNTFVHHAASHARGEMQALHAVCTNTSHCMQCVPPGARPTTLYHKLNVRCSKKD